MKKFISLLCIIVMLIGMLSACDAKEDGVATDEKSPLTDKNDKTDKKEETPDASDSNVEQTEAHVHEFEVLLDDEGKPYNKCKSCGESNGEVVLAPEHEHTFGEQTVSNDKYHWFACTTENCYEMKDKAEHTFGNPEILYADSKITLKRLCLDCGFEKLEEQKVATEVDNVWAWDEMFKSFKPTNYTLMIKIKNDGASRENYCVITENGAYVSVVGQTELYTLTDGSGKYVSYAREDGAENFKLSSDSSDQYHVWAKHVSTLNVSFEENFDKFTYDAESGSYRCTDVIPAKTYAPDGSALESIYCYDSTVRIVDGKISYISAIYGLAETPDDNSHYSFCYSNIGTSVVEIPQSVIDNAVPEPELPETNP